MTSFTANELGRLHVIYLSKGDDVLECIRSEVRRINIQSGIVVSGIGSLRKAVYHYIGSTEDIPNDIFKTIEAPLELAAVQGLIIECQPHLHIVFSDECHTYAGHLEEGCEVQYLAEIAILEVKDLEVCRKTGEFGVKYMDVRT